MTNHKEHQTTNSPWFGNIPPNWKTKRFKYLTKPKKEFSKNGEEELLSVTEVRGIIKRREIRSDDENLSRSDDLTGYKHVKKGDLVSNIMLVWKRGLGVSSYNGIVSPAYSVFTFSDECHPEFYNYLVRSDEYITEFRKHSTGITMSRLRLYDDSFGAVFAHVPPIKEQKLITSFLDKKTDQIDRLINKIQKKIKTLQEQRITLVSKCVTKGLDPNVEMKESGIEWIGKIPKNWVVTKLKYLCPKGVQYGLNIESESYTDVGIRFLRITDINSDGTLKRNDGVFLPVENVPKEYLIKKNDILFSRSGGTVGKSTRINSIQNPMSFAGYLVRFSFENEEISKFVKWVSESVFYWSWIDIQIIQSTIQNVNGEKYSNFSFPIPPKSEISIINKFLLKKTIKIDEIVNKYRDKIDLLLNYRQSLISSVVTGKVPITEDMI